MDQSMQELVKKSIDGDQMAISDLYDKTANHAYYLALEMVKDEDMAEDILQDSYVKAFSSLNTLSDPSKFQSWFNSIVVNTSKNYLKKKTPILFSQMSTTDDEGEEQDVDFVDESEEFSPEATVDYSETKRLIQEMIDNLPDEQRTAIILRYMEDYSVKQIADIMECSEGTIKSRLGRGRDKIEKDVLDLEKKGTKLYCAPLAGFLLWMFHTTDTYAFTAGVGAAAGAGVIGTTSVAEGAASGAATESTIANAASKTATETAITSESLAGSAIDTTATVGTTSGMAETVAATIAGTGAKAAAGAAVKAGAGVIGKATVAKIAAAVVAVCVVGGGAAVGVTAVVRNSSDGVAETRIAEIEEIEEGTGISDILSRGVRPDEEPEEAYFIDEPLIEEPFAEKQGDEQLDNVPVESNEFADEDEIVDDETFVSELSPEEIYAEVIDMYAAFYNGEISSDEFSEWMYEHEYLYDFSATMDSGVSYNENPYYYRQSYHVYEDTEWFYAFYDINNDGAEELFLSSGASHRLLAIWTWNGEKLVLVADDYFDRICRNTVCCSYLIAEGVEGYYEIRSDGKLVPFLIVDYGSEAEASKGYIGGDSELMGKLANVHPFRILLYAESYSAAPWTKATKEEFNLIDEWGQSIDSELDWQPIF